MDRGAWWAAVHGDRKESDTTKEQPGGQTLIHKRCHRINTGCGIQAESG